MGITGACFTLSFMNLVAFYKCSKCKSNDFGVWDLLEQKRNTKDIIKEFGVQAAQNLMH